jgi:hypothetical protein
MKPHTEEKTVVRPAADPRLPKNDYLEKKSSNYF